MFSGEAVSLNENLTIAETLDMTLYWFLSGDLDRDGDADLVVLYGSSLVWYPNSGDRHATMLPSQYIGTIKLPDEGFVSDWDLELVDMNRDGYLDIVFGRSVPGFIACFYNRANAAGPFDERFESDRCVHDTMTRQQRNEFLCR